MKVKGYQTSVLNKIKELKSDNNIIKRIRENL